MAYRPTLGVWGGASRYKSPTTSSSTLNPNAAPGDTQGVLPVNQGLADLYSSRNPTWQPPDAINAQLPNPISALKFDPMLDPAYAAASSAYTTNVQHAKDQADFLRHQYGQQYGYDASGNLITSGADLNPYAQAAIMKRNYDNSVRGTDNSYAANGQYYAGSRINAQNANDFRYGQSSDAVKRAAQAAYNNAATSVQNVQDQGTNQLASLLTPALANFLQSQRGS